jgi:acetolactate synthase-1/3 small subunit
MTIVLNLEGHALDQVSAQLFKLVNVIGIQEMTADESRQRELLMVKVKNSSDTRSEIESIVARYKGEIVDETKASLTIEAIGTSKDIATLVAELNKHGVKELVQSGLIAIEKGDVTLVERTLKETGLASSESHSQTADYQN